MIDDEALIRLLEAADDPAPSRFEKPDGFDIDREWSRFEMLISAVEGLAGEPCKHDQKRGVQDASYMGEIWLPADVLQTDKRESMVRKNCSPSIIISNFGGFATIGFESDVRSEILEKLIPMLEDLDFVFVPERVCSGPYTGSNPGVTGGPSWFSRFFDYS